MMKKPSKAFYRRLSQAMVKDFREHWAPYLRARSKQLDILRRLEDPNAPGKIAKIKILTNQPKEEE